MSDLYIILAKESNQFKIGRSKHPFKRIKQLQTGSPYTLEFLAILPNQGLIENALHSKLKRYRIRENGEWFDLDGLAELPDWIYEQINLEIIT